MNQIDRIFVINLDKRGDRLIEFMEECRKMNIHKVERFQAIYKPDNPAVGCTLSHLEIIKIAKKRGYKNILIFEDDFTFRVDSNTLNDRLSHFFNGPAEIGFKALMLAYSLYDTHPSTYYDDVVSTISYAANAAGYIVNQSCYDELITHLSYGADMLENTREHWNYINDQIWRRSQEKGGWYIFNEKVGTQRDSFSDLRDVFFCPDKPNYVSKYDGIEYHHTDKAYHESIQSGKSEPYPDDLPVVRKYLNMFPHKNRCYVDIGAHIGTTVMPFMKYYQDCVAYEPQVDNYQFLCQNIRSNVNALGSKRVTAKKLALGSTSREVELVHTAFNSGCYKSVKGKGCRSVRLDDEDISNIDFIKIDTYGSDLDVLKGSIETLLRTKPLVQTGGNNKETFELMTSIGAVLFDCLPDRSYYYFPNETLCIVPRTIFCFWTGSTEMSENRRNCLTTIKNCKLITPSNLDQYILKTYPLHPAYQYLSEVHRADYLRTYFMHFYGGGYTDIKLQSGDWTEHFEKMASGKYDACGYKEIGPNGAGHESVRSKSEDLIGNGAYIFKPNTAFTKKWYTGMRQYLDEILPILIHNPARDARDCVEHNPGTTYPIGWSRMLGFIFHPINYEFHENVVQDLPQPLFYHYL